MPRDITKHVGLGFPNRFDLLSSTSSPSSIYSPTIGWDSAWPLDNLFDRDFDAESRSTGLTANHTKFIVDHGSAVAAQALVLIGNFTENAQISWQRGSTPTGGAVGSISIRDCWQFTPQVYDGRDHHVILVLSAEATARYDYVQITDTGNPDGYLALYRGGVFPLFVPQWNASYGLRHGFKTMSGAERAPGSGAFQAYKQRVLRTEQFILEWLDDDEGDEVHELQRVADLTEEVLYIPHMSDPAAQMRYGMLGTLEEIPGSEVPRVNSRSTAFRVTQTA